LKERKTIEDIFKLYLNGEATPFEERRLMHFIQSAEENQTELQEIIERAFQQEKAERSESPETANEFSAIMDRINASQKPQPKKNRAQLLKFAAAMLLIGTLSLLIFKTKHHTSDLPKEAEIVLTEKTTAPGQKIKLMLADSTVIYLSGSSRLKYPQSFVKGKKREVYLEGEAFFEVKRDTAHPFIVHSGQMETQVLGTSFNIYAYPSDKKFSVAVRSGKVKVSDVTDQKNLKELSTLTPGQKLFFQPKNGKIELKENMDTEEMNAWINNRFVFHQASISELMEKLERYYQVKIAYSSPCKVDEYRFNATFENLTIKQVLEQLDLMSAGKIQYTIHNNKSITLRRKDCR